jgi:hypothetical protein
MREIILRTHYHLWRALENMRQRSRPEHAHSQPQRCLDTGRDSEVEGLPSIELDADTPGSKRHELQMALRRWLPISCAMAGDNSYTSKESQPLYQ